jgi:flagellin
MASVNTNYGALVALQSLNQTQKSLSDVQNQINTGLKVSSAKDNGAVFAIAEGQRARVSSLSAVSDGIDRASSTIDVALSAGQAIGSILQQLKSLAVQGEATDLSQDQRDALQTNYAALNTQINQIANAATFNGANLVNGTNLSGGSNVFSVLTSDGASTGAGSYSGTQLAIGGGTLYSASQDLATATGLTFAGGDGAQFSVTNGGVTTSYKVAVAGTDSIQDFVDAVNAGTNGEVQASYDDTTGQITYNSSAQFSVKFVDTANAGKDDNGYFDGTDGATGTTLAAGGSGGGSNSVDLQGFDFRLGASGQALAGLSSSTDISSAANATATSTAIDAAITNLNKNLATIGAQSKALDTQKTFLGQLSDSITAGIGNLVDADLAKESALLQSLQVKQQLGAQALSIANQAPSIVLSFFK